MIRVLAIDDEPLALQQLAAYIQKIPFLELVARCENAVEAKKVLDNEEVDAIFCDINMPDLNGMDFVKSLSAPPLVVFTTAYAEYAIQGYKVDALDYLLKPFGLDEFKGAANKVKQQWELHRAVMGNSLPDGEEETPDIDSNDTLFVKSDGRIVKVAVGDIVYVEGMSEYLKIHLDGVDTAGNARKPIIVLYAMKKLEERLPHHFMRIHRSFIINLQKIKEVNKSRVFLTTGKDLPIGDLYKEVFNSYLNKSFLGK